MEADSIDASWALSSHRGR